MTRICVFADEFGNFDFSLGVGATRYFGLATATFFDDQQARADLQQLRFDLAWEGKTHSGPFRASDDQQEIRDRVFEVLKAHKFRVDATILEKQKAQPQLRTTNDRFYKYAWWLHMKYVAQRIATPRDELLVIAASIGTKKQVETFRRAVGDVMRQVSPSVTTKTAQWPANADTGLQIADYCCWAIQRKWERGDTRSYDLIKDKVSSEFDVFRAGVKLYY